MAAASEGLQDKQASTADVCVPLPASRNTHRLLPHPSKTGFLLYNTTRPSCVAPSQGPQQTAAELHRSGAPVGAHRGCRRRRVAVWGAHRMRPGHLQDHEVVWAEVNLGLCRHASTAQVHDDPTARDLWFGIQGRRVWTAGSAAQHSTAQTKTQHTAASVS